MPAGAEAIGPADDLHPCAAATEPCEGEIAVPLDWSDPEGAQLRIAFAWVPRGDPTRPALGTIMLNPGGPDAALPSVPRFRDILGPLLERRNLLVVEPRGLGRSDPLSCPGLDLGDRTTVVACARELGPKLAYFTTDQAVFDMDAVRDTLGVPSVSFYGNSYGTVFAQAYATRFPRRTDAVYLDGVVLIDDDGYALVDARRTDTDIFERICARSPACSAFPDPPAALLERLVRRLRDEPDADPSPRHLSILVNGVNVNAVTGRGLLAAARAYLGGDPSPLRRLADEFPRLDIPPPAEPELAGFLSYMCGDARYAWERSATPAERRRQQDRYLETARPLAPFTLTEMGGRDDVAYWCAEWPTPRPSPPVPPDAAYPSAPVLAVAGDLDSHAPDEVAETIARFPGATLVHVRDGAHAMALSSAPVGDCVRGIMRAFLAAPREYAPPPGTACDAETFRALGSYPRTLSDLPAARSDELEEPDRRLVAAALATASDAVTRFDPNHRFPVPPVLDGVRGGEVRFDRDARTITLDATRFVEDVAVSGTIRLVEGHRAVAELEIARDGGAARDLQLAWTAFLPRNLIDIDGRLDGRPFSARIPLH